jgi:sRNA-binding carbon storage regulator CsrA
MLVLARKRHEAIVIGDDIRVEVLRLTGGVARLRFTAPRHVPIVRGVSKPGDSAAVEAVNGGIDASGLGVVELTLGHQQIITIRNDIHLGMVDVDATRALLCVDVPPELSVKAEESSKARAKPLPGDHAEESIQGLLPFPTSLGADPNEGPRAARETVFDVPSEEPIRTIPFPKADEPRT